MVEEGGYESEEGSEGGEERLFPETEGSEAIKKETENGDVDNETEERGLGDGGGALERLGGEVAGKVPPASQPR